MASMYANENFPLPVVERLRSLGHDVLTTQDAGNSGKAIPDEEVLAFARQEGRILLTLNRKHFIRLHSVAPEHAGILACSFDVDFAGQAERIDAILRGTACLDGCLFRVNRPA